MASQRFCLRWNNHQSNLLSVFDQLLHAETFTDVTLAIDGQTLKAHKVHSSHFVFGFFSVIRKRVNQVELFIIFESFFSFIFFFSFFREQESSPRRLSYVLLIKFRVARKKKKKMSDCDTFLRPRGKMSHRKMSGYRARSHIDRMWWPESVIAFALTRRQIPARDNLKGRIFS